MKLSKTTWALGLSCLLGAGIAQAQQIGPNPTSSQLNASAGPFAVSTSNVSSLVLGFGGGTIYYPTTSGSYGVIAVCPGFTGTESSIAWFARRLASHGFVTIAMNTNTTLDQPGSRATQIRAAINYVINSSSSTVRSRVNSSIRGAAEISAQFDPTTDMVVALQQVQNRLAETRGELPTELDLTVERLTPAVFPILILSMTGSLPTPDLNDFATYVVKPELARVPGAGRIEVLSSDSREIEVALDPRRLSAAGLSVVDVADALKAQNQLLPVGRFPQSGQQHLSLASGLWQSPEQIADAPVLVSSSRAILYAGNSLEGFAASARGAAEALRHTLDAARTVA